MHVKYRTSGKWVSHPLNDMIKDSESNIIQEDYFMYIVSQPRPLSQDPCQGCPRKPPQ